MPEPRQVQFRGMDLSRPLNRLRAGWVAFAQNVRELLRGTFGLRMVLSSAVLTLSSEVRTVERLNDTTGSLSGGYALISVDSNGNLWCGSTKIATGLSGNKVSMIPFRPDASVQPWMYIGDSAADGNVTITTKYAISGEATTFSCSGMLKVRSDGLVYKMGIKEPQVAPTLGTSNSTLTGTGSLAATTLPWTINQDTGFNFGQTVPTDGTSPFEINVLNASKVTISVTGTATVNGNASAVPSTSSGKVSPYPGQFTQAQTTGTVPDPNTSVVIGAFLLADGLTIISHAVTPFTAVNPVNIGSGVTLTVPSNAATLQIGINSQANTFNSNSGSFTVNYSVEIEGIANVLSTMGDVTTYYWGDSPHSGPVGKYIWKNASDTGGSGSVRSISNAGLAGPGGTSVTPGYTTGNSFIFDATITSGVATTPGIGSPSVSMTWSKLETDGSISGSVAVFTPKLESDGYSDFNLCIVGTIFVPATGYYDFEISSFNDVIWGIESAASPSSGTLSSYGQTITVVNGYPLREECNGTTNTSSVYLTQGQHGIEFDYVYWYHSGRILLVKASPTPGATPSTIPPLSASVRTNVTYAYKYRSSLTGAVSNPSPDSLTQTIPVLSNTITSTWSPDPQVDKVDYYRQDEGLANFTYVATGPNDNLAGELNTPITDALTDTQAANNATMNSDDFEPFPSIDLPRSGTCTVSGGVITRVSGDYFNVRWLPGTIIQIGTPTQLSYVFTSRPTSTTQVTIADVPDGSNLVWNISEPKMAAEPLPYLFGPTDNINFVSGVGDSRRPGTIYWCKGNNLDSAPDTNQQDVTDPSEPMVNGAMSNGLGVVASINRVWVVMPNFFNAKATATGTTGSTWTLQATSVNRGLYIPRCITVEGGGDLFFRVEDGIHISPGGMNSSSITDDELYPIFRHEGSTQTAITRGGVTIYPPDDTLPQRQQLSTAGQYLYYDYQGTDGNAHTLVYDIETKGWVWDAISPSATCHSSNDGQSQQGVLVGCTDSTVRTMGATGVETPSAIVVTGAIGGRGYQHCAAFTIEYSSSAALTLTPVVVDEGNGSYAPNAVTLPSTGGKITKYRGWFSPNKWKLLQFKITFSDPSARIYLEGFEVDVKNWGDNGLYRQVSPFSMDGGFGGEL